MARLEWAESYTIFALKFFNQAQSSKSLNARYPTKSQFLIEKMVKL